MQDIDKEIGVKDKEKGKDRAARRAGREHPAKKSGNKLQEDRVLLVFSDISVSLGCR